MVEFDHPYKVPSNAEYSWEDPVTPSIERPITSMDEVGVTMVPFDPRGGSPAQAIQAQVRGGAGVIQLVMQPDRNAPVSGGVPYGIGDEMRKAIREVIRANDVKIAGIELGSNHLNMSGMDSQQRAINEETRQQQVAVLKQHIDLAADALGGGAVDVISWEYPRHISNASWNKEKDGRKLFETHSEQDKNISLDVVNIAKGGQIIRGDVGKGIALKKDPTTGKDIEGYKTWYMKDFVKDAKRQSTTATVVNPATLFVRHQLQQGITDAENELARQKRQVGAEKDRLKREKDEGRIGLTDIEIAAREDDIKKIEEGIKLKEHQLAEEKEGYKDYKPLDDYAKNNAMTSYKDGALHAMHLHNTHKTRLQQTLAVGPEIGRIHMWGSHPDEFVELIRGARKKLVTELVKNGVDGNDYTKEEAEEAAQKHIRGTLDTGHLGHWLEYFRPDLPYTERVNKFNEWYTEQVEKLAKINEKEHIIENIQVVDAHGAGHAHLPPGQGIFPIKETVEIFKKHGYNGYIVSEGHEEEHFGKGRILSKTWDALGSSIGSAEYHTRIGPSPTFNQIHNAYMGRTHAPRQMFASYTPPFADYQPWSGLGFE